MAAPCVGNGWLIRSLSELRPEASEGVAWAGNDIIPDALRVARQMVPGGNFVLGDR